MSDDLERKYGVSPMPSADEVLGTAAPLGFVRDGDDGSVESVVTDAQRAAMGVTGDRVPEQAHTPAISMAEAAEQLKAARLAAEEAQAALRAAEERVIHTRRAAQEAERAFARACTEAHGL